MVAVGSHGMDAVAAGGRARHARGDAAGAEGAGARRGAGHRRPRARGARPLQARRAGVTTLTCTPLSAADRWFGVIFADRGGGRFKLTDEERHAMWTLGKLAALAASARIATRQQDRARRLAERIDLAREVHERRDAPPVRRLARAQLRGRAGAGRPRALPRGDARGARRPAHGARAPARAAPAHHRHDPARGARPPRARLRATCPSRSTGRTGSRCPTRLEPVAQAALGEALRNSIRHARPTRIEVARGDAETRPSSSRS